MGNGPDLPSTPTVTDNGGRAGPVQHSPTKSARPAGTGRSGSLPDLHPDRPRLTGCQARLLHHRTGNPLTGTPVPTTGILSPTLLTRVCGSCRPSGKWRAITADAGHGHHHPRHLRPPEPRPGRAARSTPAGAAPPGRRTEPLEVPRWNALRRRFLRGVPGACHTTSVSGTPSCRWSRLKPCRDWLCAGAGDGIRTRDLLHGKQTLYP
jgi:hypothetical protein